MTDDDLAIRLREVLKQTKTSQRDVCAALAIPYRTLQSYLSGKTRIPALFLVDLARFLKLELDFIVDDDFRPRNRECADAMLHALKQASLLPIESDPPTPEQVILRWRLVGEVVGPFREAYDKICRDILWHSKVVGKDH